MEDEALKRRERLKAMKNKNLAHEDEPPEKKAKEDVEKLPK